MWIDCVNSQKVDLTFRGDLQNVAHSGNELSFQAYFILQCWGRPTQVSQRQNKGVRRITEDVGRLCEFWKGWLDIPRRFSKCRAVQKLTIISRSLHCSVFRPAYTSCTMKEKKSQKNNKACGSIVWIPKKLTRHFEAICKMSRIPKMICLSKFIPLYSVEAGLHK